MPPSCSPLQQASDKPAHRYDTAQIIIAKGGAVAAHASTEALLDRHVSFLVSMWLCQLQGQPHGQSQCCCLRTAHTTSFVSCYWRKSRTQILQTGLLAVVHCPRQVPTFSWALTCSCLPQNGNHVFLVVSVSCKVSMTRHQDEVVPIKKGMHFCVLV